MNMIAAKPAVPVDPAQLCVTREALLPALKAVAAVTSARSTIPIIGNVLLKAGLLTLELVACNVDIEISERVVVSCAEPWACTVSAARLLGVVRGLRPGATITLRRIGEGADERLELVSGGLRVMLFTLPVADYPRITEPVYTTEWLMQSAVLRGLLARTQHAISNEETRYYLNGVCLEEASGEMVATATDGHRLATVTAQAPEGLALPPAIVPREAVRLLLAALGRGWSDEDIGVQMTGLRAGFRVGAQTILVKLIDGDYPAWRNVIPGEWKHRVTVPTRALLDALGQVAPLAVERSAPIALAFNKAELRVRARSTGEGEADCVVDGAAMEAGGFLELGFQLRYLRQVLALIGGDACFEFGERARDPAVIRDSADARARFVLMPMRI